MSKNIVNFVTGRFSPQNTGKVVKNRFNCIWKKKLVKNVLLFSTSRGVFRWNLKNKNRFSFLNCAKKYCEFFAGSIFLVRHWKSGEKSILLLFYVFYIFWSKKGVFLVKTISRRRRKTENENFKVMVAIWPKQNVPSICKPW